MDKPNSIDELFADVQLHGWSNAIGRPGYGRSLKDARKGLAEWIRSKRPEVGVSGVGYEQFDKGYGAALDEFEQALLADLEGK